MLLKMTSLLVRILQSVRKTTWMRHVLQARPCLVVFVCLFALVDVGSVEAQQRTILQERENLILRYDEMGYCVGLFDINHKAVEVLELSGTVPQATARAFVSRLEREGATFKARLPGLLVTLGIGTQNEEFTKAITASFDAAANRGQAESNTKSKAEVLQWHEICNRALSSLSTPPAPRQSLGPQTPPQPANISPPIKPDFDCATPTLNGLEKAICADPELTRLDNSLGEAYRALLAVLPPQDRLKLQQEEAAWVGRRVAACNLPPDASMEQWLTPEKRSCAADVTASRIRVLQQAIRQAPSVRPDVPAPAGPDPVWPRRIDGSYEGKKGAATVNTELKSGRGPEVEGVYSLIVRGTNGNQMVFGTLRNCSQTGPLTLSCVWREPDGDGRLEIVFANDLRSFDGRWSTGNGTLVNSWSGAKR